MTLLNRMTNITNNVPNYAHDIPYFDRKYFDIQSVKLSYY